MLFFNQPIILNILFYNNEVTYFFKALILFKFKFMAYVSDAAQQAMPKKPQNAYMSYRADVYDDVKRKNPEKSMTELTTLISEQWTNLDAQKKTVIIVIYHQKY